MEEEKVMKEEAKMKRKERYDEWGAKIQPHIKNQLSC